MEPVWKDSASGYKSFFSSPTGRLIRAPFVIAAFIFLWAVEIIFLWLAVQNFKSDAIVFLTYAAALFVWTLAAIWSSFWLVSRLWKAPLPSASIFGDRFELVEDGQEKKVLFKDVEKVIVVKQDFENGFIAVIKTAGKQVVVVDLFDKAGFIGACSKVPQLRLKVSQKLGEPR